MAFLENTRKDAELYHELKFPNADPTLFSWTKLFLSSPGLLVIFVQRAAHKYSHHPPKRTLKFLYNLALHFGIYITRIMSKCHIHSKTVIEPGVYLSNKGHLIIGALKIGTGTVVNERVTIGMNLQNKGIPSIGRNVWIGSNCIISGPIAIGDGVTLLPNTVLTKSVPAKVVVKGNPAKIIKRNFDNSNILQTINNEICQVFS